MPTTEKRKSSFVEQAAILAVATLIVRLLGFVYRLVLTDLIADRGNALYGVGFQFYTFALILSSSGLPNAISKMVSERLARREFANAHRIFTTALGVSFCMGLAAAVILWFFAPALAYAFGYPGSVYSIRALAPAVVIVAFLASIRGYFQGMNNTLPTAVSQVVEQLVHAIFTIWLAYLFIEQIELAAAGGAAGMGIGSAAGLLVIFGIYKLLSPRIHSRIRKETESPRRAKPERKTALAKELLRTAFPIILGTAIFSMANFVDIVMVSSRLRATGLFDQYQIEVLFGQLSGKFIVLTTLPVAISTALANAVVPSMATSRVNADQVEIRTKINRVLRLSMIISIPAAVGLGVLADPILHLLFPNHPEGAMLLYVGAVSVIFLALSQVATGMLQGLGLIKIPVIAALCGVSVKAVLSYFLIAVPYINILGAVISTIACYMVTSAINLGMLKKHTQVQIDVPGVFIKPVVAAAIMGLAAFVSYFVFMELTAHNPISAILAIAVSALMYFMVIMALGGIKKEDLGRFGK